MIGENESVELGDVCDLLSGFAFKSNEFTSDKNDWFLVKGSNVGHQSIDFDSGPWWKAETLDTKYEKYVLHEDDVILAMDRPIVGGQLKYTWIKKNDPKCLLVQRMARLKGTSKLDIRFLRYVIGGNEFLGYVDSITTGANVPHISGPDIKKFTFSLPSIAAQRRIAQVLSAYDELIENNLKRIKLLEEMAQITYEEWFVRRRINGSIIPDENIRYVEMKELISNYKNGGWGKEEPEGKFTEEGYVIRGTDIPDILSGNFNYVPKRFHTQSNLEPRTLVAGDIIMEMSNGNMGNVGRSLYYDDSFNAILGNKVMCASFCKMARAKNIGYSYLVDAHIKYIHKNNQMLVYKSQGANGINNFQFEQMIEEEIINIPENKQVLEELISYFDGVYRNLSVLRKQIHFLKEARDILLPRLMTGVIDVESYDPAQLLKEAA